MLVSAVFARPERRPGGHPHRGRVTFYEHADFRGTSFTLDVGEQVVNLTHQRFENGARANDRISSIRIEGNLEVAVFQDAGFRGEGMRLEHSVRDLSRLPGEWNDHISSVRIPRDR